jgi:hypothetical protein
VCTEADDGGGVTPLGLLGSLNADGGAGVRRREDVGGADNTEGDEGGEKCCTGDESFPTGET